MIVQIGPYPGAIGGISIYLKRMKQYLDTKLEKNVVLNLERDLHERNDIINVRFRKIPFYLLSNRCIDIVHYNITGVNEKILSGIFNFLLPLKAKKIITNHGNCRDLYGNGLKDKALTFAFNTYDLIICVRKGDKEFLIQKGVKSDIREIPAVIMPTSISEIPEKVSNFIKNKDFIISANASSISFYNNTDLYGIDMCIELLYELKKKYKQIKFGLVFCLPVVNNERYYLEINERISKLDLTNSFLFVHGNQDLFSIIQQSQLFIRPTNVDGYGVSIAEAIYASVPAIASDVCGRPPGTILFNSRNSSHLLEKVIDVYENYERYKKILETIKIEDNADEIFDIYKKLTD